MVFEALKKSTDETIESAVTYIKTTHPPEIKFRLLLGMWGFCTGENSAATEVLNHLNPNHPTGLLKRLLAPNPLKEICFVAEKHGYRKTVVKRETIDGRPRDKIVTLTLGN